MITFVAGGGGALCGFAFTTQEDVIAETSNMAITGLMAFRILDFKFI